MTYLKDELSNFGWFGRGGVTHSTADVETKQELIELIITDFSLKEVGEIRNVLDMVHRAGFLSGEEFAKEYYK